MTVQKTNSGAWWTLFLLTCTYTIGELGHFLLGSVSRPMAQELHFGSKSCFENPKLVNVSSETCNNFKNELECVSDIVNNTISKCEWNYSGLGLAYHILAGPAFMAVFTISAIGWGYLADNKNRVRCLSIAIFFFSLSITLTSFATQYWHVFAARMALAAWESSCVPLATGIIADLFPKRKLGLAMGLFHLGIYFGYGSSFSIGTHVTAANIFNKGWAAAYFVSGLPGFVIAILFLFTATEPERKTNDGEEIAIKTMADELGKNCITIGAEDTQIASLAKEEKLDGWTAIKNPALIFLVLGACIRHAGGFCWGYNSALYFKTYYPDNDVSIWLTMISIGAGISGCFMGGWLSDVLVNKIGISARALLLAISQLIAAPFAFTQFFVSPPTALYFLLGGYLAAEVWFGVMFALLVELVPAKIRSKSVAIALFCINNVGGNTPVLVDPIAQAFNYRTAVVILYPGALLTSSILFFFCYLILRKQTFNKCV